MVKLVDTLGSGLSRSIPVRVRVPLAAFKIFVRTMPVVITRHFFRPLQLTADAGASIKIFLFPATFLNRVNYT